MWAEIPDVDDDLLGVFVLAGEFDRALEVLGRMKERQVPGLLPRLRTDPSLDALRGDPRFQELLREMADGVSS
jgi:pentatricopeptide repeat protein